jgi:hypothetical protein
MFKHYQIIDRREVWIATQRRTESGFPCILWTNDQNIINIYVEHFKKSWNDTRANMIYPNISIKDLMGEIKKPLLQNNVSP